MKTARFLFVMMFATVLLQGRGLAAQASPAPQQAAVQSSEKSANEQQKDGVGEEKDQVRSKEAGENQEGPAEVTRTRAKHRPSVSHSKPAQTRPAKRSTTNSPRSDAPGNVAGLQQTGSNPATAVPNRAVSRRSPSAPPSAVSVNGQQFKNSRDPGARLAVSGGPPATTRGTAAINGTNMKRKP